MKFFIFGATGDLIKRKGIPALVSIGNLSVYAFGRKEFTDEEYKNFICDEKCPDSFKKNLHYVKIDYDSDNFCNSCLEILDRENFNYFYIALPPSLYKKILIFLGNLKRNGFKIRVLLEKPFGESLNDALELTKIINKFDLEKDLFLSDHYLFKENVIKLKKADFNEIKIVSFEKIGLEGRKNYYDDIGSLKDMVQSHLLNILFKIIDAEELEKFRTEKFILAQYGNGKDKGYVKDLGKISDTPTFAYLELKAGRKKIILSSGKSMNEKETSIEIDNKKIFMGELNPYPLLFKEFLHEKKENFPSI